MLDMKKPCGSAQNKTPQHLLDLYQHLLSLQSPIQEELHQFERKQFAEKPSTRAYIQRFVQQATIANARDRIEEAVKMLGWVQAA